MPATQLGYSIYAIKVGVGGPPTYVDLLVDTGSSNTICGARTPYIKTSTSIPTGEFVNITYGTGSFTGKEYLDQVTLAPDLVIANQSIGVALSSDDSSVVDGILGVGPSILTKGTLLPDKNATIPTVMNNLVSQGLINRQVLGVFFAPPTNGNDMSVDSSLYEGELTYVPVTKARPASYFWGVDVALCTYGDYTIIPKSTPGIVDTGTTQVLIADDFFSVYVNAIPGAKMNNTIGFLEIPASSVSSMQPLNFTLATRVLTMDVAAQLYPADQNTALGGDPNKRYGTVGPYGGNSGEGLDFILGIKFLERYYSVYDAEANRVGFAQTDNTFSTCQG